MASNNHDAEGTADPSTGATEESSRPISPPPNCSICLMQKEDKCFVVLCMHQFCFPCLIKWSKIKAICPLCKQPLKTIIHNVRAMDDYDCYQVQSFPERTTTLTAPVPRVRLPVENERYHSAGRRRIYFRNLYAQPVVCSVTGRFHDCSAQFFRNYPFLVSRLVPWIMRDFFCLLPNASNTIPNLIIRMLSIYNLFGPVFRRQLSTHLGSWTSHFIHELFTFARSPYCVNEYDGIVQYVSLMHIEVIDLTDDSSPLANDRDRNVDNAQVAAIPTTSIAQRVQELSLEPEAEPDSENAQQRVN